MRRAVVEDWARPCYLRLFNYATQRYEDTVHMLSKEGASVVCYSGTRPDDAARHDAAVYISGVDARVRFTIARRGAFVLGTVDSAPIYHNERSVRNVHADGGGVPLGHGDTIRCGNACFLFLLQADTPIVGSGNNNNNNKRLYR
jgi:hypothetical protein